MEPTAPHGFENLGGNERPHDPRDLVLGAAGAIQYTFPPVLTTDAWAAPVEYQGKQPACGAHAGAKLSDLETKAHSTPRFTWYDIKTFDGLSVDAGTDMRSIFKSVTNDGTLDFSLMGNDASLDEQTYAHPSVTSFTKVTAALRKGGGYGFGTDLSFNGLKQFISDHGPAILLIQVGSEFWTNLQGQASWLESDVCPLRPPQSVVSGHFVVAHSYDENYIYFLNSWSDGWGRKGHGYFGENYTPRVLEIGTLFPLAYTKDLKEGMTDPDVLRLQVQLNKNPKTQVSLAGAGSPGQETNYFGAKTFLAVRKYQLYQNLPSTGYCGPLTRAALSKL